MEYQPLHFSHPLRSQLAAHFTGLLPIPLAIFIPLAAAFPFPQQTSWLVYATPPSLWGLQPHFGHL